MGNQTDYFEKIGYYPIWYLGDRVFGYWNEIPFIGTVGNDTVINHIEGPRISVHLDLPIKFDKQIYHVIIVKHNDIKALHEYKD
jgi:hypothetical protein